MSSTSSLKNTVLLVLLGYDPDPLDINDILGILWPEHLPIDAMHAVMDLEHAGLLEGDVIFGSFTLAESGKEHMSALVAASALAEDGEDLGDVSTHLLSEIPCPDYVFPGNWKLRVN